MPGIVPLGVRCLSDRISCFIACNEIYRHHKRHHHLNNQDAYWLEYGHHWVMRYASASDVRVVLLGLLALVSLFAYGVQHTRYTTAVRYLQKAAERNLGPKSGGNAAVRGLD